MFFYDFPIGQIGIEEEGGSISRIIFGRDNFPGNFTAGETPLIQKAASQLAEYFKGTRRVFDLPLTLHGTEFQMLVWKALQTISYGETRSYGQVAALIGRPKASRAVGMANHNNPISIIIPCHRVIGSDGGLTGYGGGLPAKRFLLEMEKQILFDKPGVP
jgi:methylated-DNA-[protein]-cysteine S-methyltransferase